MNGRRRKLIWVGDAGTATTGLARATHAALDVLRRSWEVHCIGVNHFGDPHGQPYDIYPAMRFGRREDEWGVARLRKLAERLKPDAVVVLSDSWNMKAYISNVAQGTPLFGWVGVDGENVRGEEMKALDGAMFWTAFGREQAVRGGYDGHAAVVPLGVDADRFRPAPQAAARQALGMPEELRGRFVVGVVARNQFRKRLDLAIAAFARWVRTATDRRTGAVGVEDALLFLHCAAPGADGGFDLRQLVLHHGMEDRVMLSEPPLDAETPETTMPTLMSAFDMMLTPSQAEGFCLPVLEGMACGVPQAVPDYAATGEWCRAADARDRLALLMPVGEPTAMFGGGNSVGRAPTEAGIVAAIDTLYRDAFVRRELAVRARKYAEAPERQWKAVGANVAAYVDRGMRRLKAQAALRAVPAQPPEPERVATGQPEAAPGILAGEPQEASSGA